MEEKTEERYLGDIISTDGHNIKNIKARIAKGKGIVDKIFTILDTIPFGKLHFEIAMILRNTFLVSSMLFNSEAWYNVTSSELNLLESIDLKFLRKLLNAPKGTPKEMFYLELGCLPFREMIKERRLGFLHYILNEDNKSMINRFFKSQLENKTKKDWVNTILNDLKSLDIDLSLENIEHMKKGRFMSLIKNKIEIKTLARLEELKKSHTKVELLEHNTLVMQKYLKPNKANIRIDDAQTIFKLKCRVTEVKVNFKGKYDDELNCRACGIEEESQKHIIMCKALNENKEVENLNYENIFNGTVKEKLKIATKFKENLKMLENIKK